MLSQTLSLSSWDRHKAGTMRRTLGHCGTGNSIVSNCVTSRSPRKLNEALATLTSQRYKVTSSQGGEDQGSNERGTDPSLVSGAPPLSSSQENALGELWVASKPCGWRRL